MGLRSDLKKMVSEYRVDPKGQYFKYLEKTLNLGKNSGVSRREVFNFVEKWFKADPDKP